MATRHILECPNCGEQLLIDVEPHAGGLVQDNLVLVDHRPADAPPTAVEAATVGSVTPVTDASPEAPAEVVATPAAAAHAEATGVDLSTVEGTGKEGTITKPDVVAAAAAAETPAEEAPSA